MATDTRIQRIKARNQERASQRTQVQDLIESRRKRGEMAARTVMRRYEQTRKQLATAIAEEIQRIGDLLTDEEWVDLGYIHHTQPPRYLRFLLPILETACVTILTYEQGRRIYVSIDTEGVIYTNDSADTRLPLAQRLDALNRIQLEIILANLKDYQSSEPLPLTATFL